MMTLSPSPVIESVDQLVEYFRSKAKPAHLHRVGVEHEKFGFVASSLESLPFDGAGGIEEILRRMGKRFYYEPEMEEGRIIALRRGEENISLEPGGQFELSGAPLRSVFEIEDELRGHFHELREVCQDLDVLWLTLGENPFVPLDQIPWMPKARYKIMREYMPKKGKRGHYMMKATATVQANFDFADEKDACTKLRTAMALSPIVTALFANSSIVPAQNAERPDAAIMDRRYLEWLDTDPDRCGMLEFVFSSGLNFKDYVEWLLDVPMYFLHRDGRYQDRSGQSFRRHMQQGLLTMDDFTMHMTTAFPEVRLKGYIEVRGADVGPLPMLLALPALWKGVLYDPTALQQAWSLVESMDFPMLQLLVQAAGEQGLEGEVRGLKILDLARELLRISRAGLDRQGTGGVSEAAYLEPLFELVHRGKSLAREAWDLWNGSWNRDPKSLIAWARIV